MTRMRYMHARLMQAPKCSGRWRTRIMDGAWGGWWIRLDITGRSGSRWIGDSGSGVGDRGSRIGKASVPRGTLHAPKKNPVFHVEQSDRAKRKRVFQVERSRQDA